MKPRRPPTLTAPPAAPAAERQAALQVEARRPPPSALPHESLAADPPLPSPRLRRPIRIVPMLVVGLLWLLGLLLVTVLALRWLPPPTTAFMLQSPVKPVQHRWTPADRISDAMRYAVIASEDQKFFEHRGFDFEAIGDALDERRDSGRLRGASTISQQTAKNLFLWPGGGFARKGVEAAFTVLIETLWDKPRILEMYLNIAEFGPGIYGVEAAAQAFFGKTAAQLGPAEAARLAAVLPSPRRWDAAAPGPYVEERADWILGQMGHRRAKPTPPTDEISDPSVPSTLIESAPAQGGDVETRAFDDFEGEVGVPQPITEDQATADPALEATPTP
jgi:monofunctional biosynthetic peptidoglycan transglycosylase